MIRPIRRAARKTKPAASRPRGHHAKVFRAFVRQLEKLETRETKETRR